MFNCKYIYVLLIGACLFSSCVNQKYNYVQMEESDIGKNFPKNIPDYKIQPMDEIIVLMRTVDGVGDNYFSFNQNNNATSNRQGLNYKVDDYGNISLPNIGEVYVKDKTIDEVKILLEREFAKYFKGFILLVELSAYNITFLGEVKGSVSISRKHINILEIIGKVGGIPTTGNKKEVHIFRQTSDSTLYFTLDLTDKSILSDPHYYLMPNDIVYIEPLPLKKIRTEYADIMFIVSSITALATTILLLTKL